MNGYTVEVKKNEVDEVSKLAGFESVNPEMQYTAIITDSRTGKIAAGVNGKTEDEAYQGARRWIINNQ